MLPSIRDFFKNPQQALTAFDTFGNAAKAITQPLIAYEDAIKSIYQSRLILSLAKPMFQATILVSALDICVHANQYIGMHNGRPTLIMPAIAKLLEQFGSVVPPLGSLFLAKRGIRANSATALTLRTLHPRLNRKFDVIEEVFRTQPQVNAKDVSHAYERARQMRMYANKLIAINEKHDFPVKRSRKMPAIRPRKTIAPRTNRLPGAGAA